MSKRNRRADGGNDQDQFQMTMLEGILDTLQEPDRREILYFLQDHSVATEEELACYLAAGEPDVPKTEIESTEYQTAIISLRQNHLPRMAAASLLEYDERSDTIRYTSPSKLLDLLLQLTAQVDRGD